jgi:omega-amidase
MLISLLQLDVVWENQEANYRKVENMLAEIRPGSHCLVCLPELFSTGYTMNSNVFQEYSTTSRTLSFLADIAQTYQIYIVGSLIMYTSDKELPTNSAVVVNPQGNFIFRYDKIHLLPLSREQEFYQSGSEVSFFTIDGFRFSVVICYDLRFPEIFRILYHNNIDAVFIIANWPSLRHSHWETLIKARAVENQCFIFAVNRVGKDPNHTYEGGTSIVLPQGDVLSLLTEEEGFILEKIDLNLSRQVSEKLPFKKSCKFIVYKNYPPYTF